MKRFQIVISMFILASCASNIVDIQPEFNNCDFSKMVEKINNTVGEIVFLEVGKNPPRGYNKKEASLYFQYMALYQENIIKCKKLPERTTPEIKSKIACLKDFPVSELDDNSKIVRYFDQGLDPANDSATSRAYLACQESLNLADEEGEQNILELEQKIRKR